MATRTTSKQGRSTTKSTIKTPGKDQTRPDKHSSSLIEIVPGKFNEHDWFNLLENDDTEDFIADIFEGIWTNVSKQIEKIYIGRQLLPYTILMTENALSSVIQWAFLERDLVQQMDTHFLINDTEPTPCTMDNWGEGVVPACREEHPSKGEYSSSSASDQRAAAALVNPLTREGTSWFERPLTNFSVLSSTQKSRSDSGIKSPTKVQTSDRSVEPARDNVFPTPNRQDSPESISSLEERISSDLKQTTYQHDILVIDTDPPKLEPLSKLFFPSDSRSTKSLSQSNTNTCQSNSRRPTAPHTSSQLRSGALTATTQKSLNTVSSTHKKDSYSKLFNDERIEELIAKAPVAAHAVLKSILSRPLGYRQLELDEHGQVIMVNRIDLDKMPPRNIRVKSNVIKPRKDLIDLRSTKLTSRSQCFNDKPPENRYTSVKLVLPENSTDVGDLIQPVPGVLYEDSRLKKGDPRRYQSGLSKYKNFHDETRPLKPIAPKNDFAILEQVNDILRLVKNQNDQKDPNSEIKLAQMHRFKPIPAIMPTTDTSSA